MMQTVSTVTVAASSYDLTDLATVKDELGVSGTGSDTQLQRYITAASAAAAQFCNRVFPAETLTDVIDIQQDPYPWQVPGGVEVLNLNRHPVISVSSVVEGSADSALVADTDYRLNKANGQLLRLSPYNGSVMWWEALPVTVTYQAGYASIPVDVADAVIRMVRARWFARNRDPYLMSENIPGVRDARWWIATGTEAGNMSPDVVDLLENYRIPVAA